MAKKKRISVFGTNPESGLPVDAAPSPSARKETAAVTSRDEMPKASEKKREEVKPSSRFRARPVAAKPKPEVDVASRRDEVDVSGNMSQPQASPGKNSTAAKPEVMFSSREELETAVKQILAEQVVPQAAQPEGVSTREEVETAVKAILAEQGSASEPPEPNPTPELSPEELFGKALGVDIFKATRLMRERQS